MPDDTVLCGRRGSPDAVTVAIYESWGQEPDGGWSKKPDFIRRRLYERYIDPVKALNLHADTKEKKNGFYIMAASCLLIETLVSYWRGWETTEPCKDAKGKKVPGKSSRAFRLFFRTQPRFRELRGTRFYKHVRCGILHQGETTGGWTVERTGPLFDGKNCINATRFHNQVALATSDYVRVLRNPPAGSKWRRNFDGKMRAVIANCG
jgi:hypothetical protein